MIRDELQQVIEDAVREGCASGALPAVALPEVLIERPGSETHGDYACSVALKMARAARMEAFNLSVQARYLQHFGHEAALPSDGYPGDYVREVAEAIAEREGDRFLPPTPTLPREGGGGSSPPPRTGEGEGGGDPLKAP